MIENLSFWQHLQIFCYCKFRKWKLQLENFDVFFLNYILNVEVNQWGSFPPDGWLRQAFYLWQDTTRVCHKSSFQSSFVVIWPHHSKSQCGKPRATFYSHQRPAMSQRTHLLHLESRSATTIILLTREVIFCLLLMKIFHFFLNYNGLI